MALLVTSTAASPHWASLIAYLSIYLGALLMITILGWAIYHRNESNPSTQPKAHSPRYRINGISSITNEEKVNNIESTSQQQQQPTIPSNETNSQSLACAKYFLLLKQKAWMILSLFLHITIQAFNFSIMIEFISLIKNEKYSFDPSKISKANLTEICIISFASFILYRFGSALLIWKLSHSIRKSTFQIIDVTVLYQLLKGYKKKTRNPPGRIMQYISYLNAMFQSWAQAIVQLVFLLQTRIFGDIASVSYSFIYIILTAFLLNIYCVVKAIYKKDFLLTSEIYRDTKTFQQISIHIVFRIVDVSLRIIILAMLWLTIGFIGVVIIVGLEFLIIAYLSHFTQQMQRFQELVAIILHTEHFTNTVPANGSNSELIPPNSRPVTPQTIRMTNELQVQLNVNLETMAKQEEERRREAMRACECFKWRILSNLVYIGIFTLVSIFNEYCLICPEYDDRQNVHITNSTAVFVTIYCTICAILYPFLYWLLKQSNRWRSAAFNDDEGDIFGYLQRNDFESAREILEFGKTISAEQWIKWANLRDFSANNNPNGLINFLFQQNIPLNSIMNKSQGGLNILHQICKNPELENATETIQLLIQLGFDVQMKTEKTQDAPLHIACSYCNKSVMLALLNEGNGSQKLLVKNRLNQTPLHSLMIGYDRKYEDNQISMTSMLFKTYDAQTVVSDVDVYGQSSLHIACLNRLCPAEIIRLLLFNGANAYQRANDGFYPKDHVEKWDVQERDDIDLVLKYLGKAHDNNSDKDITIAKPNSILMNYVELSDEREAGSNAVSGMNLMKQNNRLKIVYNMESDDDEDCNSNCIDPHDMITPLDPSPIGVLDIDHIVSLSNRMAITTRVKMERSPQKVPSIESDEEVDDEIMNKLEII